MRTLTVCIRAALILTVALAVATQAMGATFNVDRFDDDAGSSACDDAAPNDCSLRGAITAANALAGADTINVPAGTYTLTIPPTAFEDGNANGDLDINDNLTLVGAGAAATIIQACDPNGAATCAGIDRVFDVHPGPTGITVVIGGVTIRYGAKDSYADHAGGGIRNGATLSVRDCVVTENTANDEGVGGGIANYGTLRLTNTIVSNNFSGVFGGGIYNGDAIVSLSDCLVSGNSSNNGGGIYSGQYDTANPSQNGVTVLRSTVRDNMGNDGGGILRARGGLVVTNSTISGNTAAGTGTSSFGGGEGGGILSANFDNGPNLISNSTISGNRAVAGGGIDVQGGQLRISSCTVADNTVSSLPNAKTAAGGGISGGGSVSIGNTIVARNAADSGQSPDCSGTLLSLGYDLIQNPSGCGLSGDPTGNITGADAKLGPLADNGGTTLTQALNAGSPAIDAGNPAPPATGGNACPETDERGFLRPRGASCDIGAVEALGGFSLLLIHPSTAGNGGSVEVALSGSGFQAGAAVMLRRQGEADIVGNPVEQAGDTLISTTFDLTGRSPGTWDVVVANPDLTSATLPAGFTIEPGGAPDLWAEIVGRPFVPPGSSQRYTILYGNRGNTDAVGVPLTLSLSGSLGFGFILSPAPPPVQAGQVLSTWNWVPMGVLPDPASGGSTNVPLLLPLVPAGFTGSIQLILGFPSDFSDVSVLAAIGDPYFASDMSLDPQVIDTFVQGAQTYLEANAGSSLSPAVESDLAGYVKNQLTAAVADGRQAFTARLGTQQIYSVTQLITDDILFAATDMPATVGLSTRDSVTRLLRWVAPTLVALGLRSAPTEARAQVAAPPPQMCELPNDPGHTCLAGCSCVIDPEKIQPPAGPIPPECVVDFGAGNLGEVVVKLKDLVTKCPAIEFPKEKCDALPGHILSANGMACIPKNPKCKGGSRFAQDPRCWAFPIKPGSHDPNDKVGSFGVAGALGGADAHFLRAGVPRVSYTISFENDPLKAHAPAQQVVITDPLDENLDLDTVELGPLFFGDRTVLPEVPHLGTYQACLGLENLIVLLNVSLSRETRTLTWRFTSVDPQTGELPTDPLVGFLPPNATPPEGQGSVSFTAMPKPGVSVGTKLCNQASIVFDDNAPLATPQWCNAVDNSPPSSHVLALAPTEFSPSFTVQWTGMDTGSGISDFTVFVSEDGGPYRALVTDTTDTTTTFTGEVGKRYAFYSVARDQAGNVESAKVVPDTGTVIAAPCAGDCTQDGVVMVNDLITLVNIVLGSSPASACSNGIPSGAEVNIALIARAVNNALHGCATSS